MAEAGPRRVALITGASRGIGQAVALRLAGDGFEVVLSGRTDSDALARTAAQLTQLTGRPPLCQAMDVARPEPVQQGFKAIFATHGRLDVLVHAAGIKRDGLLGMVPEADLDALLATNVAGAVRLTQAASRLIGRSVRADPDGPGGAIVLIGSAIATQGLAGSAVYAATKAAVAGLTRAAAKELGPQGIRVNAVAPGLVDTDMTASLSVQARQALIGRTALGRCAAPDDIAGVIAFLVGPDAAFMTGQVLGVDGGLVLG